VPGDLPDPDDLSFPPKVPVQLPFKQKQHPHLLHFTRNAGPLPQAGQAILLLLF